MTDDLDDVLATADRGPLPPADLADRLWPRVLHTYRVSAGTVARRSSTSMPADVELEPDEGREAQPRSRRAPLVAVAAIVTVLIAAGILLATRNEPSETTPAERPGLDLPTASVTDLCQAISLGSDAATRGNDLASLPVLIGALEDLAELVGADRVDGADPALANDIERAARVFTQADRSFAAGDTAIALQTAEQALWTPPATGPLAPCRRP